MKCCRRAIQAFPREVQLGPIMRRQAEEALYQWIVATID